MNKTAVNRKPTKKRSALTAACFCLLSAAMLCSLAGLAFAPSNQQHNVALPGYAVSSYMNNRARQILADVTGTETVRVLPYDFSVPDHKPAAANYYTEDGKDCYSDSTMEVKCWHESIVNTNKRHVPVYFSEVTIKHASQFRRQWAFGDYNAKNYQYPSNIFAGTNGVVGMSADFYKHRKYGIIIQYGTVICDKRSPYCALEVLTIDYDGNFQIWDDTELSNRIAEQGADDIMLSFTFGPALVKDGVAMKESHWEKQRLGELNYTFGRASIGQLGERHYLICTVSNPGMCCEQVAEVMQKKGCITVYNMDGGQSGTILFKGGVYNEIAYNGIERAMSDILYFASAE